MSALLTASVTLCAVAWLTFVVWYTIRAQWWRKPLGRNTFGVSLLVTLVVGRLAVIRLTGADWDTALSGIIIYAGGTLLAVQRIYHMEKAQRETP